MVILLVAPQLLPMKILPCVYIYLGFPFFDLKGHILAGASMYCKYYASIANYSAPFSQTFITLFYV